MLAGDLRKIKQINIWKIRASDERPARINHDLSLGPAEKHMKCLGLRVINSVFVLSWVCLVSSKALLLSLVASRLSAVLACFPKYGGWWGPFQSLFGNLIRHGWLTGGVGIMVFSEHWCIRDFTQPGMAIHLRLESLSLLNKTGVSHKLLCVNLYDKAKVVLPLLGRW